MAKTLIAITGASSGIGAAFARRLAPEHDLLLIARRKDRLEVLATELKQSCGCQAEILVADLADPAQTSKVAERLASDSRLSMLINNAGFGTKGRFWEEPLETQEEMHKLHVMATVRLTHAALQNLVKQNSGTIINVASVASFVRSPGSVSYCATKSWMTIFTEGLYLELMGAGSQVKVQALCPGFTLSEFHDRMGVDRTTRASAKYWHTPESVVETSMNGLKRNKLIVIPGPRYKFLTGLISKLPVPMRLYVEGVGAKRRAEKAQPAQQAKAQSKGQ